MVITFGTSCPILDNLEILCPTMHHFLSVEYAGYLQYWLSMQEQRQTTIYQHQSLAIAGVENSHIF